jgi:hypothetical protein
MGATLRQCPAPGAASRRYPRAGSSSAENYLPDCDISAASLRGSNTKEARTHIAWAIQQKRIRRWTITKALECGAGHIDPDGATVFLDRLPLGGFSGEVKLFRNGVKPGTKTTPQQPTTLPKTISRLAFLPRSVGGIRA